VSRLLYEGQLAWANNAGANTVKTIDLPTDSDVKGSDIVVTVRNPGASALTVRARSKEAATATFGGGADRFPIVQAFAAGVPAASVEGTELVVKDWALDATPGRLEVSNDALIGAAGAFTADVRVRVL
jgi:hypothetical protein